MSSATPNHLLIAWDGFRLPFPHILLSPFFFPLTLLKYITLHFYQSMWICSSFHQPNNLVSHAYAFLESVFRKLHSSTGKRKENQCTWFSCNIMQTFIAIQIHWCFHLKNIIDAKQNILILTLLPSVEEFWLQLFLGLTKPEKICQDL